ncbi:hypothetical protein Taro_035405 [Colocasia esculenta]|uniref:Uncharacterized protein n=1 Tax=Colocasia esculenta TaxID=4460 RepID=A0A843WD43_COLES|nr:hypothetical protein [Colocasia esculenta]
MGCRLVRDLIAPKRPMHKGTLAVQNFGVALSERVPLRILLTLLTEPADTSDWRRISSSQTGMCRQLGSGCRHLLSSQNQILGSDTICRQTRVDCRQSRLSTGEEHLSTGESHLSTTTVGFTLTGFWKQGSASGWLSGPDYLYYPYFGRIRGEIDVRAFQTWL